MVGSNFRSETQINRADVSNVTMCSCQISVCQTKPGIMTVVEDRDLDTGYRPMTTETYLLSVLWHQETPVRLRYS